MKSQEWPADAAQDGGYSVNGGTTWDGQQGGEVYLEAFFGSTPTDQMVEKNIALPASLDCEASVIQEITQSVVRPAVEQTEAKEYLINMTLVREVDA